MQSTLVSSSTVQKKEISVFLFVSRIKSTETPHSTSCIPMWAATLLYSAVVLSIRRSTGHTTVKLRGRVGAWDGAGSRGSKQPQPRAGRRGVHLSAVSDDHLTSGWFIVSQKRGIRRTVAVCLVVFIIIIIIIFISTWVKRPFQAYAGERW